MKDLTDYFTSPAKKSDVNVSVENNLTLEADVSKTGISLVETSKRKSEISRDAENSVTDKTKNIQKKKKRKKKRKPSDPVINNVSEIFSSSLSIISPNNSYSKNVEEDLVSKKLRYEKKNEENKAQTRDLEEKYSENHKKDSVSSKNETSEASLIRSVDISPNNSSEPKTEIDDDNKGTPKNKLNAFEFMMESRNKSIGQNSPGREIPEEEKNEGNKECKEKLLARKSLLQDWAEKKGASKRKREEEEKDEIINHKLQKRAKRFKKILKVDKAIKDDDPIGIVGKKRKPQVILSSSEDSTDSAAIDKTSKMVLKSPVLVVIEENAQDQLLNNSKSKETKQSLLSFFGILNKSKNSNDEHKKIEEKEKHTDKKNKMLSQKVKKKKSRISVTNEETGSRFATEDSITEQSTIQESETLEPKKKLKKSVKISQKTNKTPLKDKEIESENDSLTPHSLKTWKMRIKLNLDTEKVEKEGRNSSRVAKAKRNTFFNYIEHKSDESSNEGKIKTRATKQVISETETISSNESDIDSIKNKRPKRCSSIRSNKTESEEIILSESEDDSRDKTASRKPTRVAPVFIKAIPKPRLAPEVLEARKQFLMSGIPSSLKKVLDKQQSMEEREYDIFPSISHIQQKCESSFWNLPKPQLHLTNYLPTKVDDPNLCTCLTTSLISTTLDIQTEVKKVDKLKTLLNKIKADNPNYPVNKSFRLIYEKSGKTPQQKQEKKSKRKQKNLDHSIEIVEPDIEGDLIEHAMWTEKYKPQCSDDIIGNSDGVNAVKKWLDTWLKFSQEINMRKKRQREGSTSESEFDITDCDSRDSTKLPGNTFILGGPCGSGKSTAIYAICKELGFNVIELNASSKRTGKRLLQELQEATQSHQVRKAEQSVTKFLQTNGSKKKKEPKERKPEKKMCVLLVEDVDIVFEQDDGFISALTQLVTTSKRPIIMTTTDSSSAFVQKFVSQHDYISFLPLSSQTLATWLQIVCLVEGLFVSRDDIGSLLEFNGGDARKTLLELQYWVQSGGQINRDDLSVKIVHKCVSTEGKMTDDEQVPSCVRDKSNRKGDVFIHTNCISSFEIFRDYKPYTIPYYINLGLLWWNIPNLLGVPDYSSGRLNRFTENKVETDTKSVNKRKSTLDDKLKLESVERLYDSLALTDVMFRKVYYFDGNEPNVRNHSTDVKDSLELDERMQSYDGHSDFVHEITHRLVNGCIEEYNAMEGKKSTLDMSVPCRTERRWRAKQHVCEDVLQEALSLSNYVERKSVTLDYMPSLRNMSRSEARRAVNNTKRGKRFRNYLRDLNINYNDGTLKLACNILTIDDDF